MAERRTFDMTVADIHSPEVAAKAFVALFDGDAVSIDGIKFVVVKEWAADLLEHRTEVG